MRSLGRVRLRVCACMSYNTSQFRRIHARGVDGGSLLPLQKVNIPAIKNSQGNTYPLIKRIALQPSL